MSNGFHNLYIRVKDENGRWSLTNVKSFYKETVYATIPNIVEAEYFFNEDPGFGNGIGITVTPGINITDLSFTADASGLLPGVNRIYVRVKDENEKWSLTYTEEFDVQCSAMIVDFSIPETCEDEEITIVDNSENVYSLATYYWNFGDGSPILETSKGNVNHTFNSAGNYNVKLKIVNNAACSDSLIKIATIKSMPDIPTIPIGSSEICVGTINTEYTTNSVSGAVDYFWEITPVSAGVITDNGISAVVTWNLEFTGSANIRVRAINSNCSGVFSNWKNVVIYPESYGGILTAENSAICQNSFSGEITLSGNIGSIVRWEKNISSVGWTTITNTSSTYSEIITQSGNIEYRVIVKNSVCSEATSTTAAILVNSIPQQYDISGGGAYCEGGSGVSVILENSETNTIYKLYKNSYYTNLFLTGIGDLISFDNISEEGVYTIIAEKNLTGCTNSMNNSVNVIIDELPENAQSISGDSDICENETNVTFSVPTILNADFYVWTLPIGVVGNSTTNSITVNFDENFVPNYISVKGQNNCGDGGTSNLFIDKISLPSDAETITGNIDVCAGESSVIYSILEIENATTYVWSLPNGAVGSSESNTITVNFTNNATSGYISVYGQNECGPGISSSLLINVNPLPDDAGIISGDTEVCQEENDVIYIVNTITDAENYIWTLPDGNIVSTTTNSIEVDYPNDVVSGELSVFGQNSCGNGNISSIYISINPLPENAGNIVGFTEVCQGVSGITYSLLEIPFATSYLWTLPNGVTGSSVINSISVNFAESAESGVITVLGQNNCGEGISSSIYVLVNEKPQTPIITFNGNTLYSNAINGNQWYNQFGLIENAIESYYVPIVTGNYYTITTLSGCSSGASNVIFVEIVGINEISNAEFKVYPNPVENKIIIEISEDVGLINYELTDIMGKIILKGVFSDKTIILFENFPIGIYFVNLRTVDDSAIVKIIKQ